MEMEFFSSTNHKLSDNSTRVTVTGSSYYQNVFGNVLINSASKESHCWQFKILKNRESYGIDIGIVEDGHLDSEPSFTSKGVGYGFCSNGNIYSSNCHKTNYKLKNCKQKYKTNDLVLMTLDLNTKTLSFFIENGDDNKNLHPKKIIIKNIKTDENTKYKMAVYLSYKKDSVKLLNHIKQKQKQSICNKHERIINKLKKENEKFQAIIKQKEVEYEYETKVSQNELSIKCAEIDGLQNIIKQKDLQLKETQNKLNALQIKLDELTNLTNGATSDTTNNNITNTTKATKEKERNKGHFQVIQSDDSWRIDLKSNDKNNNKKRRRSVMALEQKKSVSQRLSRSAQKLFQT